LLDELGNRTGQQGQPIGLLQLRNYNGLLLGKGEGYLGLASDE
jgi:hypothetical protein